jgi:hypothetical protein
MLKGFIFRLPPDGKLGGLEEDGKTWNGMVGMLIDVDMISTV